MFATVTADRGDRPMFLEFCKHQLSRMSVKPDHSYFITDPPKGKEVDLVPRVREGIKRAKEDGFKEIYILESDDFYPANYFETMKLNGSDFIGSLSTTYYHLKDKRYQETIHHSRSSLFTTGFNIRVLDTFPWPSKTTINLDIHLWYHAQKFKMEFVKPKAVGIKHGCGKCAGSGHWRTLKHSDENMEWLKANTDSDAFIFYKTLNL